MKFIEVNPSEIDNIRRGRRGRVSYPILKGFLETNKFLVKLDLTGIQQSKQSLTSSLNTYIRNHQMPIKLFQRAGDIFLMRLDVDEEGNKIDNWQIKEANERLEASGMPTIEINDETVTKQFEKEKGKVTK